MGKIGSTASSESLLCPHVKPPAKPHRELTRPQNAVEDELGGIPTFMIPRDPNRIDRMVELLREAWHLFPDERLTQLVINASDAHHDSGPLFYLEDEVMEQRLRSMVAGRRKFLQDGGHDAS